MIKENREEKNEESRKLIGEIVKECESVENFQKFIKHFNDAWEKVKTVERKNEELNYVINFGNRRKGLDDIEYK